MRYLIQFYLLLCLALIFSGCSNISNQISEPTAEEIAIIKPIGDQISGKLVEELQKELKAAIKSGGFEEAVRVCNMEAAPIKNIVAQSSNRKVDIKRTSNKYRNPMNAPDKFEIEALDYFEDLNMAGKPLPDYYIQRIEAGESKIFNYYKPMMVGNNCLICHGSQASIKPEILNRISELYPEDKALDYKENDFRGLIRITFGN